MYFTNGDDPLFKFDGVSLYRLGLPYWQAGVHMVVDTSATNKIIIPDNVEESLTGIAGGGFRLTLTAGEEASFASGQSVTVSGNIGSIVTSVTSTTSGNIRIRDAATATNVGTSSLKITRNIIYKYYFRLRATDRNGNTVVSAAVGNQSFAVTLAEDAGVAIRLVGLPTFHAYDYDNVFVDVFRTQAGGDIFYPVTTRPINFDNGDGYVYYEDGTEDANLGPIDGVQTALAGGGELPTGLDEPMKARYVTSSNNKLILGHLEDYPVASIQFDASDDLSFGDFDSSNFSLELTSDDTTINTLRVTYENTTSFAVDKIVADGNGKATITASSTHGLSNGEWVYMLLASNYQSDSIKYAGWYQVKALTATTFDIYANHWPSETIGPSPTPGVLVVTGSIDNLPVYEGTDPAFPNSTGTTAGVSMMFRTASAINAYMATYNTSIVADDTFTPWLTATGGAAFSSGNLTLRSMKSGVTIARGSDTLSSVRMYVNGTPLEASSSTSFEAKKYNSRLLVSYPNYPEVFDNPRAVLEQDSQSIIDINSADGQEITGVIPFFGDSTTQDSQKEDIIIVFKTNSVYAVNIRSFTVTKIDSRGIGCTAPYSIAQVPNGIIFANEAGMYRLNRSFDVIYIGRLMERRWQNRVNLDRLDLAQGHSYAFGQQYKLSIPVGTATENDSVYVYDYSKEQAGQTGSWTRYDNHPSTGWVNLRADSYFSSTSGKVFSIRRAGNLSDFRDDSTSINFEFITRANNFGQSGRRKQFRHVVSHFRAIQSTEENSLYVGLDLKGEFSETQAFKITLDTSLDNLSDTVNSKITSIRHSFQREKGVYIQLKYSNNGIDQDIDLSGISFAVSGLDISGIQEAAESLRKTTS